jgi:hypothetical protein
MAAINISGQTIVVVSRDPDAEPTTPECLVRVYSVAGPKDNGIKLPAKIRVYRVFIYLLQSRPICSQTWHDSSTRQELSNELSHVFFRFQMTISEKRDRELVHSGCGRFAVFLLKKRNQYAIYYGKPFSK